MANETLLSIRSLNLNAADIRGLTGWGETMTNDYLTTLENFRSVASRVDAIINQVTINTENIEINRLTIENHINSNSQHGVLGVNVGTENYCTFLVGGVVNLCQLVLDASVSTTQIVTAPLDIAPATYDQAYTQLQSDLINEERTKINSLITDLESTVDLFNELLAEMIVAKQMSDT